jgi:hypothetical protein
MALSSEGPWTCEKGKVMIDDAVHSGLVARYLGVNVDQTMRAHVGDLDHSATRPRRMDRFPAGRTTVTNLVLLAAGD